MKEKNKKMIIIVTSLLLVVGVSLAYFTASVLLGGDGASVTGSTTTIQDSTLIVEGTLEFNDLDIYPGHESVSSIRVTATGNNELIPYNVIWKGTNTLNTPLNYTVYKTSSSIEVNTSCEKKSEVMGGAKIYYEECSISNLESLGSPITEGTITTSEEETTIELIGDEFINSTSNGTSWYYYVILEYPNLEESQNIDMGGTFNGEITIEESDAEPDINIIAAYIEQEDGSYEQVSDIPQSGYTLNTERSTCSNGAIPSWTNGGLFVSNLTKSETSCYLYFDEFPLAKDAILAGKDIQTRNDFNTPITNTTTGIIYQTTDWAGTSYYFAGAPTDNWVKFGEFYWRIIRINGDGSVRLIYNGTSATTTGNGTLINNGSDHVFNSSGDRSEYVGLKYTSGEQHGQATNSIILNALQSWYNDSGLLAQQYSQYIDINVGFCSDRNITSGSNWSSQPSSTIYYAAYGRLANSKKPSLSCISSDIIKEPVGLITADEVAFAGGVYNAVNQNYYLYNSRNYWTMSPYYFYVAHTGSYIFNVSSDGSLNNHSAYNMRGIRPVINLKVDTLFSGSGTVSDPYVVVS